MARSTWKGLFFHPSILKKTKNKQNFKSKKIWSRSSVILREFVGHRFEVHDGKAFVQLTIKDEMIGFKFGEFVSTRKVAIHKKKK